MKKKLIVLIIIFLILIVLISIFINPIMMWLFSTIISVEESRHGPFIEDASIGKNYKVWIKESESYHFSLDRINNIYTFDIWIYDFNTKETKKIAEFDHKNPNKPGLDVYENKIIIGTYGLDRFLIVDIHTGEIQEAFYPKEYEYSSINERKSIYLYENYIIYKTKKEIIKLNYKTGEYEVVAEANPKGICNYYIDFLEIRDNGRGIWTETYDWCEKKEHRIRI